jgi:EAL domain-containing protein (putative c-di-GMP-specific phosphodiesterase class I)
MPWRAIAAIKALGVRISVDDFGTGYSSLSQLQRLDLDVLKVDRAFTQALDAGKQGEAFFMTIVSMAHILDMQVVAEGVETREQLAVLQTLGCNEVQGYFISRPVPAKEAEAFLAQRHLFPQAKRALQLA